MNPRTFAILFTLLMVTAALAGCSSSKKSGNGAPTAVIKVQGTPSGYSFILNGDGSTDPDGDPLTYAWNWQLNSSTEKAFEVEFDPALGNAKLMLSLVVRDPSGASGFAVDQIELGNGTNLDPKPAIDDNVTRWVVPDAVVTLDGRRTVDPDGDPLYYEWILGPLADYDAHVAAPADGSASKAPNTFSTGMLADGDSFNMTFDRPGTFNYHCHPHPWMKARLVVDPDLPKSPDTTIAIRDFAFANETVRVGVGTQVTFVNQDAAVHTATLEDYTPGTKSAGTTPIFSESLAEGDYVVRLIAADGKGGRGTRTWGLQASTDAPKNPTLLYFNSTDAIVQGSPRDSVTHAGFEAPHGFGVSAILEWDPNEAALGNSVQGNFSLWQKLKDGSGEAPVNQCRAIIGSAFEDLGKALMGCRIKKLNDDEVYFFKVKAEKGALTSTQLVFSGTPYSVPPFGDSEEDAGHEHHH